MQNNNLQRHKPTVQTVQYTHMHTHLNSGTHTFAHAFMCLLTSGGHQTDYNGGGG